ncbi:ASTE1-like protein [Mya arenaria]|uniref:ASTE1-like protein n=1 Tax=Mya arenaria TaxID=6604 RepID=A0ABY7F8P0_MYAAR|nr:protein asteroid homolog 1-like [Mya arenaria]WAR18553.1 ASTE1-like protein [Mya arenaria]
MGVRGLFTLIDDNKDVLLDDFKLHDTRLLIDGSNLYHYLYTFYHVPGEYGGNYDTYAEKCKSFFTALRACKVEPYVVMDGGYNPDNRKWNTVIQRKASRRERAGLICENGPGAAEEQVLPILCEETFRHVLRELQIPHVTCPYEADRELAVLANRWNCPILSNDSDFFVFKLESGVIPFGHKSTYYLDIKLRLYNTQTKQASLLKPATLPTDQEFVFISVKKYHYESLTKRVSGSLEFLPIFATFSGNDYVDKSHLKAFYTAICKQYKDKPLNLRAKARMTSIIHWSMGVQLDENAIQYVLQHVADLSSGQKSELRAAIRYSIDSYTNINEFATMDVAKFFGSNTSDISILDLETLIDYVTKHPLPAWCSEMLRTCKIATFLQNVAVNHRVIFDCQIEHLAEPSTYACSRYIRSVLYGLKTSFIRTKPKDSKVKADNLEDLKGTRKSCIEESDRQKGDRVKVYIKPTTEVFYGSQSLKVPSLQNVPDRTTEERLNIMYGTLGLNSELTETISSDPCTTFLIGVLRFWWTNAEPKVTENHLSAAVIGLIFLHAEVIVEVMKKNSDASETVNLPGLVSSIVNAIENQGNTQVIEFASKMAIHRNTPTDQASWGINETKIIHGFSQLQTCFLSALYLNHAMMSPVDLPSPGVLFNFTFMYNVCRNLGTSEITDCSEMFHLESSLYALFTLWKTAVKSTEPDVPKGGAAR